MEWLGGYVRYDELRLASQVAAVTSPEPGIF